MSFQLEVQFAGLAIYVVDAVNGRVGVLLPDCRRPVAPHLDDTPADPHVAYLRFNLADIDNRFPPGTDTPYRKRPEYELVHRLDKQLIHFEATFATEPTVFTPLDIPDFSEFAPTLELIPGLLIPPPPQEPLPPELLVRTTLRGGSLVADATEEDQWKIPRRFIRPAQPYVRQFASSVRWTRVVDSPALVVRIMDLRGTTTQAEFTLRPPASSSKVIVKIANLCADNPLEWSELRIRKVTGRDLDFKWLYRLLRIPGKTYKEFLLDDELPVPEYVGELSSGSDDCMPAKITGTVPELP